MSKASEMAELLCRRESCGEYDIGTERHQTWRLVNPNGEDAAALILELEAENAKLWEALKAVLADIADYEQVNHLSPNPPRQTCWDSVSKAREALGKE